MSKIEEKALETFANTMIKKLEKINTDWKQPWFSGYGMAEPVNLDGRAYNGRNILMLMLLCEDSGYDIPVFCTFDRISSMNFDKDANNKRKPKRDKDGNLLPFVSIKKGEKSFPVFIYNQIVKSKIDGSNIKYSDYVKLSDAEKNNYVTFPSASVYKVFNVAQTNLKESRPELYKQLEDKYLNKESPKNEDIINPEIDGLLANKAWLCPIEEKQSSQAFYSITKDSITVPQRTVFNSGEAFCGTLLHEIAHSTGAKERLDRIKIGTKFGDKDYAREELVAELTAALICSRHGMEKYIKDDSAPYINSWLKTLKASPIFIKQILSDVQKASTMIEAELNKQIK